MGNLELYIVLSLIGMVMVLLFLTTGDRDD